MAKPVLGKSVRSDWFLLGRDFARRTVSMETVQDVYFCFGVKPATSKFAITTAKKKVWTLSFFIAKLPEKAKKIEILLSFQRWMKKTNILRASSVLSWTSGNFWLRNWNGHYRKSGGHRRFYQPTEKCKHKQEDGYWYEHSSPLHGSYWYEKWENWKLTWVRAWPPFVEIFLERTQEKWRRVRASNSFQFLVKYTGILKWEEISI